MCCPTVSGYPVWHIRYGGLYRYCNHLELSGNCRREEVKNNILVACDICLPGLLYFKLADKGEKLFPIGDPFAFMVLDSIHFITSDSAVTAVGWYSYL